MQVVNTNEMYVNVICILIFLQSKLKTIKCIFNNKQVFEHRMLRNKIHEDNWA